MVLASQERSVIFCDIMLNNLASLHSNIFILVCIQSDADVVAFGIDQDSSGSSSFRYDVVLEQHLITTPEQAIKRQNTKQNQLRN